MANFRFVVEFERFHCISLCTGGSGDGSYLSEQLQASIQARQAQIEELDRDLQAKQQVAALGKYQYCIQARQAQIEELDRDLQAKQQVAALGKYEYFIN